MSVLRRLEPFPISVVTRLKVESLVSRRRLTLSRVPIQVDVEFPNEWPNSGSDGCSCEVKSASELRVVLVKREAILRHEGKTAVFVVKDSEIPTAQLTLVETGKLGSTQIEITKGLRPGDRVIVSGQFSQRR